MIYYTEFFQKYFGDALNVVAHRNTEVTKNRNT